MYTVTANFIAIQQLVSYAAAIALVILLLFAYRRLQATGFLIVALGCILGFIARVIQVIRPPFLMGKMPFSHMRTLDDLSRATEFNFIYSCHILAGLLIVLGTIMVIRTWRDNSFKPTPLRGEA
jgi:hypothetical protein